jgi:hypothetical protein
VDTDRIADSSGLVRPETSKTIFLNAGPFAEPLADQANTAILNWLAAITARRLKIAEAAATPPLSSVAELPQPAVECEFVGSD